MAYGCKLLQNPVSSPMAKHAESWLKTTDKAAGLTELSITGLVFMMKRGRYAP